MFLSRPFNTRCSVQDTRRPAQDAVQHPYARRLPTMLESQSRSTLPCAEVVMPHVVRQKAVSGTAKLLSFLTSAQPFTLSWPSYSQVSSHTNQGSNEKSLLRHHIFPSFSRPQLM